MADQRRFPPVTATLKDSRRVTLRLLSPNDRKALGDLYATLPRATWRFYCPPRLTREDADRTAAQATSPTFVCVVAENDIGEIIGYNWYRWKAAESPTSVFGICLREDARGLGLGRALMMRLLEMAREVGPPIVSLTVQLANPRAVALYRSMGFHIVREQVRDRIADFPPEPEYYMELNIRDKGDSHRGQ